MPKKSYRSHGEGSLTERGPGRFRLRYKGPERADGKRSVESETFKGTKTDAVKRLQRLIRDVDAGTFVKPSKVTLGAYLVQWLDGLDDITPKTRQTYATLIRNYINPSIGSVPLQALAAPHVRSMHTDLRERGLSVQTRTLAHRALNKALEDATEIKHNPVSEVKPPKRQQKHIEAWRVEDIARFLAVADGNPFRDVFEMAFRTGLRRGELAGLKWSDIDAERGSMTVSRSLQRITGQGLVAGGTKSHRARSVAISPRTVELLKRVQRQQAERQLAAGPAWTDAGWVFTDELGLPYDSGRFTNSFKAVAREAAVPDWTLHGARHAYVSLLAAEGVSARVISEMAGHSTVAFTLSRYTHLFPEAQQEAAQAIDMAFGD